MVGLFTQYQPGSSVHTRVSQTNSQPPKWTEPVRFRFVLFPFWSFRNWISSGRRWSIIRRLTKCRSGGESGWMMEPQKAVPVHRLWFMDVHFKSGSWVNLLGLMDRQLLFHLSDSHGPFYSKLTTNNRTDCLYCFLPPPVEGHTDSQWWPAAGPVITCYMHTVSVSIH